MSAAPILPYSLPTGAELMSTPIGGKPDMTRAEKEKIFVIEKVAERLSKMTMEESYETTKWCCFCWGVLIAIIGVLLILMGFQMTVLFQAYSFDSTKIIAGGCLCLPIIIWFLYIVCPLKWMRRNRAFIAEQRRERKRPGLFNDMVAKAQKSSEPPIIRTRIVIMLRKKEIPIMCHTMEELQGELEMKTGLPPERQILRVRHPSGEFDDVKFKPSDKILEDMNYQNGMVLWAWNTGGYEIDVNSDPRYRMPSINSGLVSEFPDDDMSEVTEMVMRKNTKNFIRPKSDASLFGDEVLSSLGNDQTTIGPNSLAGGRDDQGQTGGANRKISSRMSTRSSNDEFGEGIDDMDKKKKSSFSTFLQMNKEVNDDDELSDVTMNTLKGAKKQKRKSGR